MSLSRLFVRIGADTRELEQGVSSATGKLSQFGQSIGRVGAGMTKYITGPMTIAGGALTALAVKTGNYADEILDLAAATGHSTDRIQEFQAVADRAGVATTAFTDASRALTMAMGRGAEGSATFRRGIEKLGLSYEELKAVSPDERMSILMTSLQNVEDAGQRAAIGNQVLRGSYEQLAPVLSMTETEMQKVISQAHETGRVMSEDGLNSADAFRKGLDELKAEFTGLFRTIAVDIMPVLNDQLLPAVKENIVPLIRSFAETITDLMTRFANLSPEMQKFIIAAGGILYIMGPVLMAASQLIAVFTTILPLIKGLGLMIAGALSPPLLILAGILAAVYWAWVKWEDILGFLRFFADTVGAIFGGIWTGVKGFINMMLEGINLLIRGLNRVSGLVPGYGGTNISEFGGIGGGSGGIASVHSTGASPAMAGAGAGDIVVQEMVVRKESDITDIAQKLHYLEQRKNRRLGP